MDDTSGYPVIGSVHTLASAGFLTAGCMSAMGGICPKVIGSDAESCAQGKRAQGGPAARARASNARVARTRDPH
jgi:hypothetical protein